MLLTQPFLINITEVKHFFGLGGAGQICLIILVLAAVLLIFALSSGLFWDSWYDCIEAISPLLNVVEVLMWIA